MIETGLLVMFVLLGTFGTWAAYRNGVNDGYNAARYPDHHGYQKARKILERTGQWKDAIPSHTTAALASFKHKDIPRKCRDDCYDSTYSSNKED